MNSSNDIFPFTPLVIIGAARSGTNALRNSLTKLPSFATWPCDEINPIWRHGNLDWPDDEIPVERVTPAVRKSIRKAFYRIWRQQGQPAFIVEKTCANTLRVPFVDAILPEAYYIHLVRDGYDVIASARRRWRGELEVSSMQYYVSKALYAPFSDLPRYAISALKNRLAIKLGRRQYFESWGPRFAGIDDISANSSLDELIARQWVASVNTSDMAFSEIKSSRVFNLRYEDFTADPYDTLTQISRWLNASCNEDVLSISASTVRASSVGKGHSSADDLHKQIKSIIAPSMRAHHYFNHF